MGITEKGIRRLFRRRPTIEITEISLEERERILSKVVSIMLKSPSKLAFNGGSIADIEKAFVRSLFEMFVRHQAMELFDTTFIATIDSDIYNKALKAFSGFVEQADLSLIRDLWMEETKYHASSVFAQATRVFEPYIIGELCEKLYLDNKSAEAVIEELEREDFLQVVGKQYNQNLIEKRP